MREVSDDPIYRSRFNLSQDIGVWERSQNACPFTKQKAPNGIPAKSPFTTGSGMVCYCISNGRLMMQPLCSTGQNIICLTWMDFGCSYFFLRSMISSLVYNRRKDRLQTGHLCLHYFSESYTLALVLVQRRMQLRQKLCSQHYRWV